MSRREFSKRVKLEAFERCKGLCENCTVKLGPLTGVEYDHRIPDALGGEPTLENCVVLCKTCHKLKTTKNDVPVIAKSKRVRSKHLNAKKPTGRPMPGSKRSKWKRKMDGSIVPR